MSKLLRWNQVIPENARRSVGALARNRYLYLPVTAVVLAVAIAITLTPRGLSTAATSNATASPAVTTTAAPNDDGVTWDPTGSPTQTNDGHGNCEVNIDGTVSGNDPEIIASLQKAMDDEPVAQVNQGGIESLAVYASPPNGTAAS